MVIPFFTLWVPCDFLKMFMTLIIRKTDVNILMHFRLEMLVGRSHPGLMILIKVNVRMGKKHPQASNLVLLKVCLPNFQKHLSGHHEKRDHKVYSTFMGI
jgi:hypothetical protein